MHLPCTDSASFAVQGRLRAGLHLSVLQRSQAELQAHLQWPAWGPSEFPIASTLPTACMLRSCLLGVSLSEGEIWDMCQCFWVTKVSHFVSCFVSALFSSQEPEIVWKHHTVGDAVLV